ncbi:MAG: apolipoprotein N-acyltransferase [Ignavibacteriales bacterium]|nr:apolipoprotein N-acyltransferase [Ignavibacteriales bacterium]
MISSTRTKLILAISTGLLLAVAFPPVPIGVTAFIAFVPFFFLLSSLDNYGQIFRYGYLTIFIFNLLTTYWTGGFTHFKDYYLAVAGMLLILAHPFFFLPHLLAWMFIKKQFGFKSAIILFPFLWIAFEYLHAVGELSFPWLTLGNTQTYDIRAIQFVSFTGVWGVSFWILIINLLIFILIVKLILKEWKIKDWKVILLTITILCIYFLPRYYGQSVMRKSENLNKNIITVSLIQPNIDAFEKWTVDPETPLEILKNQTIANRLSKSDLVIWPETAIPFYILHPNNRFQFYHLKKMVDSLNINLLTGIPDIVYYSSADEIPKSSKKSLSGERYETFNSSMLLLPRDSRIQKYAKIILVPFAERVPFSEELSFLNAMEWNFGLGGWGHGKDTTVFRFKKQNGSEVKFSTMICYESVYPNLVRTFVNNGAEFLTVVTNDSWWGNTSGAYQHKQYAILRAVENRRWMMQCSNGGISCFVDPYGRITSQSDLFTKDMLTGQIEPRVEKTFYTEHGEWLPELCIVFGLFVIMAGVGNKFYHNIRSRE